MNYTNTDIKKTAQAARKVNMRYCVDILTPDVSPLYSEIRYNHESHFFGTEKESQNFMVEQRKHGKETTSVMDLENLPF